MQNPKAAVVNASLALKIPGQPHGEGLSRPDDVLCEGWLLKKRRKKLQGYARRYFTLRPTGLLCYSFEPNSVIRDQIFLPNAAISSTSRRRDIHVDSGRVTFHVKCLNETDFDKWMASLRKFTVSGLDHERTVGRRSVSRAVSVHAGIIAQASILLDEMGQSIEDLTHSLNNDRNGRASSSKLNLTREREHKDGHHSILSMFKKTGHSPQRSSFVKEDPAPSTLSVNDPSSILARLREQHTALSEVIMKASMTPAFPRSPLPQTIDEEGEGAFSPGRRSPATWQSLAQANRSSISTAISSSGSGTVWFDASEGDEFGAEEFVLDDSDPFDDETTTGGGSQISTSGTSIDRAEESEVEADLSYDDTPDSSSVTTVTLDRRTRLPARPNGDEGSLFAILKKNVGQDLSNISFPVSFNEPLTLLQRLAEETEYYDLLNKAAATSDWVERISFIAAFAVSSYASTKFRSGRKGFTPLLAETFEDHRMNFLAEKVVHKPLVMAYYASGSNWELTATSSGKTKFWGKSFEIIPTGLTYLKIGEDEFEWNKPSSFTRNLMMGTKYLEHCGEMVVRNTTTGARCVLDFKETGYWASSPNVVAGSVYAADGGLMSKLEGKWDDQFAQKLDANHLRVLWRISPFPRDASEYYGFTYFGITLNELTPELVDKLPKTDSRLRPDVRALENGNNALAESEKARVEQLQRDRREAGAERRPRWFRRVGDSDRWEYVGGYWEARKAGWKNSDNIPLW